MPGIGLLLIVGGGYDVYAKLTGRQTISAGWGELMRNPITRMAVGGALGVLAFHLDWD